MEAICALCAAPRGTIESAVRAQVGRAIQALQTQNGRFNRVQFLAQLTEYSFHIHNGVLSGNSGWGSPAARVWAIWRSPIERNGGKRALVIPVDMHWRTIPGGTSPPPLAAPRFMEFWH
jgi:hypothetical protein